MADQCKLVLIADDDQAVRDALQFALRLEGICVHVHSGGAALLADPDLNRAKCVILGDRMQQMDGFTVLGRLKSRDIRLPTIMLSNHATPRIRARADAVGVWTILEKPLLDNALVENLRSILGVDH